MKRNTETSNQKADYGSLFKIPGDGAEMGGHFNFF